MSTMRISSDLQVPFFRPELQDAEINEVVECLKSGWLTMGPRTLEFEAQFAQTVKGKHAVAVNSGTAALHLAVESLGLSSGHAVLVPTLTFAATAEVVRYQGATPILVDCDPDTLSMDLGDAARKIALVQSGRLTNGSPLEVVGIMPVHVGGLMMNMDEVQNFASRYGLWVVEDSAHAFPSAYRNSPQDSWRYSGNNTSAATCFSFYANKTITTGEGGMVVTDDSERADRLHRMRLHGLSQDAWRRYSNRGSWDYRIVDIGFKYNVTDIAAAIGIHQLERAEVMRQNRQDIATRYNAEFADLEAIELPPDLPNRIHSWHLYPIRLCLDKLTIDRNDFLMELKQYGVGTSVHWRPLHLHPYYEKTEMWPADLLPVATKEWVRFVSLPIFQGMREVEIDHVTRVVRKVCEDFQTPTHSSRRPR